jgi:release factor glutamine methyltransferase
MSAAPEEQWTVRKVMGWTTSHFEKQNVDAPRLTAEMLLAHLLHTDRVKLYSDIDRPLEKSELAAYRALIQRRIAGEPTQYLVGHKQFYNRRFAVDPRVLIPRPETELLVEAVLRELPKDARVIDLCTGSACIAATIALERPDATVFATDISEGACAVARENCQRLKANVQIVQSDLFATLDRPASASTSTRFDLIVSNPPYVKASAISSLQREVQREPRAALDGGADGLELIRRIATEALGRGGALALEIGDEQGDDVREILLRAGYLDVKIEKDLARLDRLAFGRAPHLRPSPTQGTGS